MLKAYEPKKWNGKAVTKDNLLKCTGHPFETWAKFTGFIDDALRSEILNYNSIEVGNYYPDIELYYPETYEGQVILLFVITINIRTMSIKNEKVNLLRRGEGIGKQAHMNQISIASKFGFRCCELRAFGGKDQNAKSKKFNGHVTWAKFGYTMTPKSLKKFQHRIQKIYPGVKCLEELFDIEGGEQYWEDNGWAWDGEFDLSYGSQNYKLLDKYLLGAKGA